MSKGFWDVGLGGLISGLLEVGPCPRGISGGGWAEDRTAFGLLGVGGNYFWTEGCWAVGCWINDGRIKDVGL